MNPFLSLPLFVTGVRLMQDGKTVAEFQPPQGVPVFESVAQATALYLMPAQGNA